MAVFSKEKKIQKTKSVHKQQLLGVLVSELQWFEIESSFQDVKHLGSG